MTTTTARAQRSPATGLGNDASVEYLTERARQVTQSPASGVDTARRPRPDRAVVSSGAPAGNPRRFGVLAGGVQVPAPGPRRHVRGARGEGAASYRTSRWGEHAVALTAPGCHTQHVCSIQAPA